MIRQRDLHVLHDSVPITIGDETLGRFSSEYEILVYSDVRNLAYVRAYQLICRQRLTVTGSAKFQPASIASFLNYPAVLAHRSTPIAVGSLQVELVDYFPKTLNTAISSSLSSSKGKDESYSQQSTRGSSTSETNSYEVSASGGAFGPDPVVNVGASASHSTTTTTEKSTSQGMSSGQEQQLGMSSTMTIKDWAVYATPDLSSHTSGWIWGQEYPWSVLDFHNLDAQENVILPSAIQERLYDGDQVYPPSQLALYGIDFSTTSRWLITVQSAAAEDEAIRLSHSINYFTGSHQLSKGNFFANLDDQGTFQHDSPPIDLPLLGLDPVLKQGPANGAVVGFIPKRFLVEPAAGATFRILSNANTLYVTGQGFEKADDPARPMQTHFPSGTTVSMTVQFKIIDSDLELALYLKHWKTTPRGCMLSVVVNGNSDNPILRHVDSLEASAGADNLTMITLRNLDYASDTFCDYLVAGVNSIIVSIAPTPTSDRDPPGCGYALRALAIG